MAAAGGGRREGEIEESMLFASSCMAKNKWGSFGKREEKLSVGEHMPSLWSVSERTGDGKGALEAGPTVRGTIALPDGGGSVVI